MEQWTLEMGKMHPRKKDRESSLAMTNVLGC